MMDTGYYYGMLRGIYTDQIGANKTPFLVMVAEVNQYAMDGNWIPLPEPINRKVKFCLKEGKAWEITQERLISMGFNGDFDNPRVSDSLYQGIQLECKHKDGYEDWIFPDFESNYEPTPLDKQTLKTLSARFKQAASARKIPAQQPPSAPELSPPQDVAPPVQQPVAAASIPSNMPPGGHADGMENSELPF